MVSLGLDVLFEGPIAYDDAVGSAAPISVLSHVTLQWFDQNSLSDPDPGFIESLKVEITPASAGAH